MDIKVCLLFIFFATVTTVTEGSTQLDLLTRKKHPLKHNKVEDLLQELMKCKGDGHGRQDLIRLIERLQPLRDILDLLLTEIESLRAATSTSTHEPTTRSPATGSTFAETESTPSPTTTKSPATDSTFAETESTPSPTTTKSPLIDSTFAETESTPSPTTTKSPATDSTFAVKESTTPPPTTPGKRFFGYERDIARAILLEILKGEVN